MSLVTMFFYLNTRMPITRTYINVVGSGPKKGYSRGTPKCPPLAKKTEIRTVGSLAEYAS
jgi:hypothetical protein